MTVACWDHGLPRLEVEGVKVHYISREGGKIRRLTRFFSEVLRLGREDYDLRYVIHFTGSGILPLLGGARRLWALDVRTACVNPSPQVRRRLDRLLRFDAGRYEHLAVIAHGVAEHLEVDRRNPHIVPLGAVVMAPGKRRFDELRLLYVGTLESRNMDVTIEGLARFVESGGHVGAYTIVGGGGGGEEERLRRRVSEAGLDDIVTLTGRLPHTELGPLFESHNCGVAYIPVTDYFDHQPPLKVFEYLLAGMPALATRTAANEAVVEERAGELIGDSAEDFARGLERIASRLHTFDSDAIRDSAEEFRWDQVIERHLRPFLGTLVGAIPPQPPPEGAR